MRLGTGVGMGKIPLDFWLLSSFFDQRNYMIKNSPRTFCRIFSFEISRVPFAWPSVGLRTDSDSDTYTSIWVWTYIRYPACILMNCRSFGAALLNEHYLLNPGHKPHKSWQGQLEIQKSRARILLMMGQASRKKDTAPFDSPHIFCSACISNNLFIYFCGPKLLWASE